MADPNTLIEVSAFSGLAGALISQSLSGLFTYLSDKRKSTVKTKSLFRNKKIEIAEHFYYVPGETMTVLKKSIEYWKDRNKPRSEYELISANNQSHLLYLKLMDVADHIKLAKKEEQEKLYGQYHVGVFDLCSQYEYIYHIMEADMQKVKTELLNSF